MSDELIEAMARVFYACDPYCNHDPLRHKAFEWEVVPFERAPEGHLDRAREAARALLPVIRAHLEPTSEMVEAVEVERSLLAESSQFLSDVYNLLCPIKSEWEQAGMWTEFDEAVFNKRADLNLRIQDAIRSNTNG